MKRPIDVLARLLLGSPEQRQKDKEKADKMATKLVDGLVKFGDEVFGPIEREVKRAQKEQDFAKAILPSFLYDRFWRSMSEEERKQYVQDRAHYLIARANEIESLVQKDFDVFEAVERAKAKGLIASTEGIELPKLQVKVSETIEALYRDLIEARVLVGKDTPGLGAKDPIKEQVDKIRQRTLIGVGAAQAVKEAFQQIDTMGLPGGDAKTMKQNIVRQLHKEGLIEDEEF